jgi:cysteine synthase/biotin carboxylase
MLCDSMRDAIGQTPLVRLSLETPPGTRVYAKLELANPFGMKDRVARNILTEARRLGVLAPGNPIVESSSGTMALGVALAGRSLGHPVHIVTDPRMDRITLTKLRALGCRVHIVRRMISGGWQGARLARLDELMRDMPGAFWPQQYRNPDNPTAYRSMADELLTDLGALEILVGAVGSGGSLCGAGRALRRSLPCLRVVGVDSVGSALFDQPDLPGRLQSGLGNSLHPENLDRTVLDEVHWLNDHEAFSATRCLAEEQQIFGGNTSGSVYRVLGDVARRAAPGSRIVGIFPDRGDRYAETVYDDEYWAEHDLDRVEVSPRPAVVGYGSTVRNWSRADLRHRPQGPRALLFVEANTSGTGVAALRTAATLGLRSVLLTRDAGQYASLADTECEVVRCETNTLPALRDTVQRRFRREEIAGVGTTSDFYVPAAADLAAWLDLPGNTVEAGLRCRDKTRQRRVLADAGVRQPRFFVAGHVDEVADGVRTVGLPCVVKPADESGSSGVRLCRTPVEAEHHAAELLTVVTNRRGLPSVPAVLIEEFVDGPEYSVETFSVAGEIRCVGVTAKSVTGGPSFVESGHVFPAPLPGHSAAALTATASAALKAIGFETGAAHTEVKLTDLGPAVVEVNPRPAGGMIPELIRLSSGLDLIEQQVRVTAGLPVEVTTAPIGCAGIRFVLADRPGVLRAVTGLDRAGAVEGVAKVAVTAAPGRRVRRARDAYDRLGYVIARAPDARAVQDVLDRALGEIHLCIEDAEGPADD